MASATGVLRRVPFSQHALSKHSSNLSNQPDVATACSIQVNVKRSRSIGAGLASIKQGRLGQSWGTGQASVRESWRSGRKGRITCAVSTTPERTVPELNDGIAGFYDESSGVWEEIWGEHMHHGYYPEGEKVI
jgi:hypothetical protein